jgi:hypothetical protein
MIMMVATVMIQNVVMALVMEMKHMKHVQMIVQHHLMIVQIVHSILLTMVLNVVIQHGMSLV